MREDFLDEKTFQRIKRDIAGQDFVSIMENCTLDVPTLVRALDYYRNDKRLESMAQLVDRAERYLYACETKDESEKERGLLWMKKLLSQIRLIESQTEKIPTNEQ